MHDEIKPLFGQGGPQQLIEEAKKGLKAPMAEQKIVAEVTKLPPITVAQKTNVETIALAMQVLTSCITAPTFKAIDKREG